MPGVLGPGATQCGRAGLGPVKGVLCRVCWAVSGTLALCVNKLQPIKSVSSKLQLGCLGPVNLPTDSSVGALCPVVITVCASVGTPTAPQPHDSSAHCPAVRSLPRRCFRTRLGRKHRRRQRASGSHVLAEVSRSFISDPPKRHLGHVHQKQHVQVTRKECLNVCSI